MALRMKVLVLVLERRFDDRGCGFRFDLDCGWLPISDGFWIQEVRIGAGSVQDDQGSEGAAVRDHRKTGSSPILESRLLLFAEHRRQTILKPIYGVLPGLDSLGHGLSVCMAFRGLCGGFWFGLADYND